MMKKFMFFALASVALLASCSSDDTVAVDEANVAQAQDGPVAIQLGLGQVAITRGTGTVGTNDHATNFWKGQKFNVFMLKHGTMELATDVAGAIYADSLFIAPTNVETGLALDSSGAVKYYPATGRFDFWGYRLDSAQVTKDATITATEITRDFKIDGSQDIMVAWADTVSPTPSVPDNKLFSAFAARRDVQPVLNFRHLLSRLHFTVEAGNASSAETAGAAIGSSYGVVIDSIKVIGLTEGTLTIAHLQDDASFERINWTAATEDSLVLKQRKAGATEKDKLGELQPVLLTGTLTPAADPSDPAVFTADKLTVGEALLVKPNEASYKMIVFISQKVNTGAGSEIRKDKIEADLAPTTGFLANHSYEVTITVYGLEEIEVNVTLTPWEDGPAILVDPETL